MCVLITVHMFCKEKPKKRTCVSPTAAANKCLKPKHTLSGVGWEAIAKLGAKQITNADGF